VSTRTPDHTLRTVALAAGVALAVLVTGCAQVVPGQATAVRPTVALPLSAEQVAATATATLQELWRDRFPATFGREWTDIATFTPVDTADADAPAPPCLDRVAELANQALYCTTADAVVWDADGFIPELHKRFGPAGVVVVLAHEVGHAVQTRLGLDEAQARNPGRYPTILLEAMADCYAGVALAHLADRPIAGLPLGASERDEALLALVGFRDPLGVDPSHQSAHGNAFDRVSAFQDGYLDGATRCADMSLDNRAFTQRRFGSVDDLTRGGDLPLSQLLTAVENDARDWFTTVAAGRVPGWQAPPLRATGGCPARELAAQGPARFCAADGAVSVDPDELGPFHQRLGDYAGATLVASRYGLAALDAAGADTTGSAAGAAAVCLAGAYTGRLIDPDGTFSLSPGDLDEAVQVLLEGDWAARDATGVAEHGAHGFDRVGRFRAGLLDGPDRCLPTP